MNYTALSCKDAPSMPGVYRIIHLSNEQCYVGVTRNLRRRFSAYNNFSSSTQWRLNLCKDSLLSETLSLSQVFNMTMFLFEYEILETFTSDVSNIELKEAEEFYFNLHKPTLNRIFPNYSK